MRRWQISAPGDQVRLYAVDLNAIPLMDRFAAPDGPETRAAISALRERIPLGATDMAGALAATSDSFAAAKGARAGRAAVYIGDGMSTANLLGSDALLPIIDQLTAQRVPVSSYAIGPRVDTPLLACLANQTGGVMAVDGENYTGAQVGNWLAAAVQAPVVWPKSITLPNSLQAVTGKRALPLRYDRDTILVGKGQLPVPASIRMTAEAEGQNAQLDWQLKPSAPSADFAFLAPLVQSAQRDAGLTLPTLGTQGLNEVRRLYGEDAAGLNRLGRVALASGNADEARRLAEQALEANAADEEASAIVRRCRSAAAIR